MRKAACVVVTAVYHSHPGICVVTFHVCSMLWLCSILYKIIIDSGPIPDPRAGGWSGDRVQSQDGHPKELQKVSHYKKASLEHIQQLITQYMPAVDHTVHTNSWSQYIPAVDRTVRTCSWSHSTWQQLTIQYRLNDLVTVYHIVHTNSWSYSTDLMIL